MNRDIHEVNNSFYDRYNPLIRSIVAKILSHAEQTRDIDDCVNTVFLELIERLRQYNETRGSLAAFVAIITRSVALNYYKKNTRKNDELIGDETIDFILEPVAFENKIEFQMLLESIFGKLTEQESILFTMKYIYFYPADEIAKTFKISRNSVDGRVDRLKKKIRNFLKQGGITI